MNNILIIILTILGFVFPVYEVIIHKGENVPFKVKGTHSVHFFFCQIPY